MSWIAIVLRTELETGVFIFPLAMTLNNGSAEMFRFSVFEPDVAGGSDNGDYRRQVGAQGKASSRFWVRGNYATYLLRAL